jgi:hypothetical protein
MTTHLTLRLPTDLARALARLARERRVAKSLVVREAVARYLSPPASVTVPIVTAGDVADRWASLPHLTPEEADALAADLDAGRRVLPSVRDPWA